MVLQWRSSTGKANVTRVTPPELLADLESIAAQMDERTVPKSRPLIPGKDDSRTISYARASVKGSRKTNEDNHGATILDNYAFLLVCDGHGPVRSSVLPCRPC